MININNIVNDKSIKFLTNLAVDAGKLIKLQTKKMVNMKDDKSPLTNADIVSNELIIEGLEKKYKDIPIVSEEIDNIESGIDNFFLIDPLDGTKEFLNGTKEYTVNIAYISNRIPLIGVVYVPEFEHLYWTNSKSSFLKKNNEIFNLKKFKQDIDYYNVELSRSHIDEETMNFVNKISPKKKSFSGSSLKICNLCNGESNLYPRFGRTMEWDTAAGHAILKNLGGEIFCINGERLVYSKKNFQNPAFIAISCQFIPENLRKILSVNNN